MNLGLPEVAHKKVKSGEWTTLKGDLAIPLGISYEFNHVVLDARYNLSLTKAISAYGESTKHRVFQITLGYKFGL